MKTEIKNLFLLPILIAALGLMLAGRVTAQTFKVLYSFTATSGNKDGAGPAGGLVLSDSTLYGTATSGGSFGYGVVFAINTDGTGFTNLHSLTSDEGTGPSGGLILSGNTLYGTTKGAYSENGTVFAVKTDGTGFATLKNFTNENDGVSPRAGLVLSGNTLYGTTYRGGNSGNGTAFALNTDGSGFTKLHDFTATSGFPSYTKSDGANPYASLTLSGNTLYGTAYAGGSSGNGTVFSIFIHPQLTIIPSEANVILTWPTNYTDFILQSATNLVSPVWITNSQVSVIVNGQNTVTNPISGTQQFFRLSH